MFYFSIVVSAIFNGEAYLYIIPFIGKFSSKNLGNKYLCRHYLLSSILHAFPFKSWRWITNGKKELFDHWLELMIPEQQLLIQIHFWYED